VVDAEGTMLGIMTADEARARASELGIDLVEISSTATPPVCKLIDYGKFLYEEKKKQQENKKSEKTHEIKGLRLTFKIDVGDLERQKKLAEKFLAEGNSVRIQMQLRGRERAHTPLAVTKLTAFLESLSAVSSIEQPARPNGFQIIAILKPSKK
jgi:translation initiation factor IF-3